MRFTIAWFVSAILNLVEPFQKVLSQGMRVFDHAWVWSQLVETSVELLSLCLASQTAQVGDPDPVVLREVAGVGQVV